MAEQARWYVIHTYSGYENKVAKSIDTVVGLRGMQDLIIEVKVPTEIVRDVMESGEVTENERKLFPGYVLVQMVMNDDTWVLIKNIRGVTGFVGPEGKPVALTEDEVKALDLVKSVAESPFNQGDHVRVTSGPMVNFSGSVESVDMNSGKVRVVISMGGRDVPAEVSVDALSLI